MHTIEPFYNWRDYYISEEDERSPFYGKEYSEFQFHNKIYNYFIHPQWDEFGSTTLYLKIIFVDYHYQFAVIELIGEWNDCIHNDIMFLKQEIIDEMMQQGIDKFILIGENVLNFHASDDCYYEEWWNDVQDEGGWIAAVNFREHVLEEMSEVNLHHFMYYGDNFSAINWRTFEPIHFFNLINNQIFGKALRDQRPGLTV